MISFNNSNWSWHKVHVLKNATVSIVCYTSYFILLFVVFFKTFLFFGWVGVVSLSVSFSEISPYTLQVWGGRLQLQWWQRFNCNIFMLSSAQHFKHIHSRLIISFDRFDKVAMQYIKQVLLHLLRAGYYLHKTSSGDGNQMDHTVLRNCPMRTIYFENPTAFAEINSFTYDTAST